MRTKTLVIGIAALAFGGLILLRSLPHAMDDRRTGAASMSSAPASLPSPDRVAAKTAVALGNEKAAPLSNAYADAFESATDLWDFAASVHDAASAGDPEAQYYLAHALKYCADGYRFYFIRGNKRRTLDEALQWASTRSSTSIDEVREIFEKCRRLADAPDKPFGDSSDWLKASKDAGYDLAMIESAQSLATKAGVSGASEDVEMRNEAKRLALAALRTGRPEVIFTFGDFASLFVGNAREASQEQWVWRLAACERGFDCSHGAEWVRFQCRFDFNCQPQDDGIAFIHRNNSEDFDELQRRARELNEKLDAGKYDDLLG
ncbi:MAG: hypothetical protein ABI769_17280 [Pseudomonadota bacterium]